MVLPFLTMPDDVLAHFARQLSDATTAGRLAQTSRAGDQLMRKPIGCQSYERNVRHQLRQLLRPRLQSEGHGAKLCTTALKHQGTVSTTAALLVTSRGARHVAPHCVFAVQAKPANFRITYSAATQENTEF